MFQFHGGGSSGACVDKGNIGEDVKVVGRRLNAFHKEHYVEELKPVHEGQEMKGTKPGFVVRGVVVQDVFGRSTLDLL